MLKSYEIMQETNHINEEKMVISMGAHTCDLQNFNELQYNAKLS